MNNLYVYDHHNGCDHDHHDGCDHDHVNGMVYLVSGNRLVSHMVLYSRRYSYLHGIRKFLRIYSDLFLEYKELVEGEVPNLAI